MTRLEREIITDSMLKIQSVQASLDQLDEVELTVLQCLVDGHLSQTAEKLLVVAGQRTLAELALNKFLKRETL